MKKKVWSLMLMLSLVLPIGAGCQAAKTSTEGSTTPGSTVGVTTSLGVTTSAGTVTTTTPEAKGNAKALEVEKTLMAQLQPLPAMGKGEKVGALLISLTNPYWVGMKEAYEAAAKDLGITVEVFSAPTEGDKQSQLETLDSMAVKDYNAIILSPIEPFNLIPGILRANENKIPVINLGPGIDVPSLEAGGGHLDGRITVNFEEQGKIAATDMLKYMTGSKKVAIIQGIVGAAQSEGRTKGAKETFEATAGVELVSIQPGKWDRNTAFTIANDLIQAHPDLNGIFACNDVMALGAAEALEAAGKLNDVKIYGVDFTEEARVAIKSGKMTGSVAYPSSVYAKAALILAMKISQGMEVKPVYAPLTVVNKDNVNEFDGWK